MRRRTESRSRNATAMAVALVAASLAACSGTPPRATSSTSEQRATADRRDAAAGDAIETAPADGAAALDAIDSFDTVPPADASAEQATIADLDAGESPPARMPIELGAWLPAHGLAGPLPEPAALRTGEPAYAGGCYEQEFGRAAPLGLDCLSPLEVAGHWEESFHTLLVPDHGRMRIVWHGPLSAEQMYDEEGAEPGIGLAVTFSDDGAVMTLRESQAGDCARAHRALAAAARHWDYQVPVARVRRFFDEVCATQGVFNRGADGRYVRSRGGATVVAPGAH